MIYQNYHKHTFASNIMTPDSSISLEDYAKRCVEIGSKVLSSVEHGWQGLYYETYDLAKKYDLKFIFGTEAYWVKNRLEKDDTNAHIVILAKNEIGRKAINVILSEANETGYYYKPRLDLELILSLPPKDVLITSACIAFWKYEDSENTALKLHKYFKENFMLEVQYHNADNQKLLNKHILELAEKNNINIIMGCDSHYINENQKEERLDYLRSKHIIYADEDSWYMDFPSIEDAYNRFLKQKILTDNQIKKAINNTNIILEFDNIIFDKEAKLPTIYPNKTQEEKNTMFKNIINEEWSKIKETIPKEKRKLYIDEIRYEVNTIINTKMTDYFLLDYKLVKEAKKRGGIITQTGRGSGVCYYINKLLGLTNVDRISAKIQMYPERFISEARILESKTLPDLDLNLGNPEIFAEVQEELLGKGHSYPMIAFGTLKEKSAFKMYARTSGVNPETANEISQQIEKYEKELKYIDEDEKDTVDIFDYIDKTYHEILKASEKYRGIISDKKAHTCGYLIYNKDIKSEIGLIRCKSESTGKDTITTVIDGATADKFGFLKNDLLKVDVVKINHLIYKKLGMEPLSVDELLETTKDDKKTWDMYHKGLTVCVNQVEKNSTRKKIMKYKPTNIIELSYFIGAIRPGFRTMYNIFESKEPFSYNIKVLDKLIQTKEFPYSLIIFQEQIMRVLNYVGIPIDESYNIIKAISKKKKDVIMQAKEKVVSGFYNRVHEEEPDLTDEEIKEKSNQVWAIIESCISYLFNAPHAYSVSLDSLTGAYLKSHYPYEFYETVLQVYSEKKKKDKINIIKNEMQTGFEIQVGKIEFGIDNRGFKIYKEQNFIADDLSSIKYLNIETAENLYKLSKNIYNTFTDLLIDIKENTSINVRQLNILMKLNYFKQFYKNKKLLQIHEKFEKRYKKTHKDKTKIVRIQEIKEFELNTPNEPIDINEQIIEEKTNLGYAQTKVEIEYNINIVLDVNLKYTPKLNIYSLREGMEKEYKIYKKAFKNMELEVGDIILITNEKLRPKMRKTEDGFEETGEKELYITGYSKVSIEKLNKYFQENNITY